MSQASARERLEFLFEAAKETGLRPSISIHGAPPDVLEAMREMGARHRVASNPQEEWDVFTLYDGAAGVLGFTAYSPPRPVAAAAQPEQVAPPLEEVADPNTPAPALDGSAEWF